MGKFGNSLKKAGFAVAIVIGTLWLSLPAWWHLTSGKLIKVCGYVKDEATNVPLSKSKIHSILLIPSRIPMNLPTNHFVDNASTDSTGHYCVLTYERGALLEATHDELCTSATERKPLLKGDTEPGKAVNLYPSDCNRHGL